MSLSATFVTHAVDNQPPPLAPSNLYLTDQALREHVTHQGGRDIDALTRFGAVAGDEMMALGYTANENKPKLKLFDRYGHRLDEVEFHPSYHRLMQLAMQHGVHSYHWRHTDQPGSNVVRAALSYMSGQADSGTGCPLTMTYAAVPALKYSKALAARWLPLITSTEYDPRLLPAEQKTGCTLGMGMTEKQGGSDVRANTTQAVPQPDGSYEIVGHKWFFSAPMCDAWLVLARTKAGISCFLMPKLRPDGSRNAIRIQRLKDKLGDWSNASSEVEFHGAYAELCGEDGRGVATILEMVALTRQDCMIGSAALMRQSVAQALHHARHRQAFGKFLIDQPLMQNVLADLALESEAALALSLRVACAIDASHDDGESAFARIATAIGKYWICKRAPTVVNEAQECLGGAGYVEESNLPRLYRQAPLNSIWEGSGNIQCLDVLRALSREPDTREALFAELMAARGGHPDFDRMLTRLPVLMEDPATLEMRSRQLTEELALALQASLLIRAGNSSISDHFCRSRLGNAHGIALGTLPFSNTYRAIIDRASPLS